MQQLTPQGQQIIQGIAQRYGVSFDAVATMLQAVTNGGGTMAQFNHYELGGGGQWMLGGMTMVGDMFNHGLKYKVDGLCTELSNLLSSQSLFAPPPVMQSQNQSSYGNASIFVSPAQAFGQWWPGDLGSPSSTGAQNDVRYAVFPGSRRLVVEIHGNSTVYDTLDHQIGGVSQQQGYGSDVTFNSQYGVVPCSQLPVISHNGQAPVQSAPVQYTQPLSTPMSNQPSFSGGSNAVEGDVFQKIERLGELLQKGYISNEEFTEKKRDLLSKL